MELHKNREEQSHNCKSHMQNEIVAYKQLLDEYKISFCDLTNECPKNADNRQEAINIAKLISNHHHLATFVKEKKQLPIMELQKFVTCSQKTITKYKKYIIALSLIYAGNFTYMKDYINI